MENKPKLQKEVLRCRKCNKPLAQIKHDGGNITFIVASYNKSKRENIIITCQHKSGGIVSIECEECQGQISPYYNLSVVVDKPKS